MNDVFIWSFQGFKCKLTYVDFFKLSLFILRLVVLIYLINMLQH